MSSRTDTFFSNFLGPRYPLFHERFNIWTLGTIAREGMSGDDPPADVNDTLERIVSFFSA